MAVAGFRYWALVGSMIALPATMTVCMWTVMAWIPGKPGRMSAIHPLLRFGGTITLNNLVVHVAYSFDKMLLGRFWGADVLGIYSRAYQLINIPNTNLLSAVGGVAFSALSRVQADPARCRSYFLKGYTLVNALTLPTTIFCAVFATDIIRVVLGPKWMEAAPIFRLLAPTILVFGIINPTGWLLQAVGLHARSLRIAFVIAPLVMAACVLGLPYGATGVAFAFSAAMTLWVVPHVFWSVHGTIISAKDLLVAIWRPLAAGIAAGALAFAVVACLGQSASPIVRLLVGGGVMAAAYASTLLVAMGQRSFYFDLLRALKRAPAGAPAGS
jgi:PST family polysaccharide transporter